MQRFKFLALLAIAVNCVWVNAPASAAIQYTSMLATWDNGVSGWSAVPGGPYFSNWNGYDDAVFEGTGSAVTIPGTVNFNSMTFNVNGYTLSGGGLGMGSPGGGTSINVAAAITAGITSGTVSHAGGSTHWTKTGTGLLNFNAADTSTSNVNVNAGTLVLQNANLAAQYTIAAPAVVQLAAGSYTNTTFTGAGTLRSVVSTVWGGSAATFAMSSGSSIDVQSGTFTGGSSANENWVNNQSNLNVAGGALFNGVEANVRVGALSGTGIIRSGYGGAGYSTFTFGVGNASGSFGGTLSHNDGFFYGHYTKEGSGTQTFTGTINTIANGAATGLTISQGTVEIGGAGTFSGGTWANAMTNNGTFHYNSTTSNTLTGVISGSGALIKGNSSVLYLDGANNYTGLTTVTGGYLVARNNTALGTNAAGTIVQNGATLQLEHGVGINIANEAVSIIGNGVGGTRGALASWTGANTWGGSVTMTGNSMVYVQGGSLSINGVISGPGYNLEKTGAGDLIFGGSASNTYSGTTIISAGNLLLNKSGGAVAIVGPVQMGNGVSGQPNLRMSQSEQFGPGVVMNFANPSGQWVRFDLLGTTQTLAGITTGTLATQGGGVVQNGGVGVGAVGAATLTLNGSGNYVFNGHMRNQDNVASGVFNLVKNGSGTQTLVGGVITHTGTTTVSQGTLELYNTNGFNSATSVNSGATLKLSNTFSYGVPGGFTIALNNGGTLVHNGLTNGNDYFVLNGAVTNSGTTIINQDSVTNTTGVNKSLFLDGGLRGTGTVTINATNPGNAVVFRNNNSNFAGTIIVNGIASTTVNAGSGIGVGGATTGLQNADITLNGTMELLNQGIGWAGGAPGDFWMGALNGSGVMVGNFTGGGETRVRIGNTNNNGNFSGEIANGTGNVVVLTKVGTGQQNLSGTNTYTGRTTVSGGTLEIDGSINNSSEVIIDRTTVSADINNGRLLINAAGTRELGTPGTGNVSAGVSGFGHFQNDAGTTNIGNNLRVGVNATGVGLVNINGGIVNVANQLLIGGGATGGTGVVNIAAGGTLNVNGNTTIIDSPVGPNFGTLNIAGAYTEDGDLIVGQNATGIVTQTGGSASINDNLNNTGNLILGQTAAGSLGTYNLSGGTLHVHGSSVNPTTTTSVGNSNVGVGGRGIVNHNAGTFLNDTNMTIGGAVAGSQYNLSGSGLLNFRDTQANTQVAATDNAASTLLVGANGDFNFNGGTLMNVTTIDVNSAPGNVFTQDGGRFVLGVDGVQNQSINPATIRAMTTITGDFVQNDGTLVADIFGRGTRGAMSGEYQGPPGIDGDPINNFITDNDLLFVMGDATLDGTLEVHLNGVDPLPWGWYDVLVADSITITDGILDLDGGIISTWRIITDPSDPSRQILQVATPEPASVALWCLVAFIGLVAASRLRRTVA